MRGTAGALSALVKSIISKTYLLHYGSDFLPFLELLPSLVDRDAAWALKVDDSADESDDSYSLLEEDDDSLHKSEVDSTASPRRSVAHSATTKPPSLPSPSRERKPSLPLSAKTFLPNGSTSNGPTKHTEMSSKHQLKELLRIAQEVNLMDSEEIAQEITRIEVKLFLDIEVRASLAYSLYT